MCDHRNVAHTEALRRKHKRVKGELGKLKGGHRAPKMKKISDKVCQSRDQNREGTQKEGLNQNQKINIYVRHL